MRSRNHHQNTFVHAQKKKNKEMSSKIMRHSFVSFFLSYPKQSMNVRLNMIDREHSKQYKHNHHHHQVRQDGWTKNLEDYKKKKNVKIDESVIEVSSMINSTIFISIGIL